MKNQGSLFEKEPSDPGPGGFNRVVSGKEAEGWFQRHDRGEISIDHLIMEERGTWRIKGRLTPRKKQPAALSPYDAPMPSKPIFKPDAPADLLALEKEVRRRKAGLKWPSSPLGSPTKAQEAPTKEHRSPSKPAHAARQSLFDLWK